MVIAEQADIEVGIDAIGFTNLFTGQVEGPAKAAFRHPVIAARDRSTSREVIANTSNINAGTVIRVIAFSLAIQA
ncbi:hypothetical protein D3C81_2100330 [compost metagenome]